MSANIQSCLWNRSVYPNYVSPNPYKELAHQDFVRKVYGDRSFVNRLELHKELVGHQGCVNALYWSQYGDKLLSGSDDQTLRIWYPFDGSDYQKNVIIKTGHRDNIFAAKFMPNTADQIVISAAGDSEIRIFDLNGPPNEQLQHVYTCHSDPVKRICTEAYNPHEFLTCSEDGTVRHFDLRQPHTCTPHYIRSFNTATRRHSRNYSSQHRTVSPRPLRQGCPKPLLDYSQYGLDINSMTINKHRPQYFVIAGMDDYMYLHDRRMICSSSFDHAGRNVGRSPTSQCVLRFTPSDNRVGAHRLGGNQYVTACRFSDANGYELLGNWAASGVYLFNIMDSPVDSERWTSTFTQSSAPALQRLRQYQQQRPSHSPLNTLSPPSSPLATDPMTMSDDGNDDNTILDNGDDDSDLQTPTSAPPSDRTKLQVAANRESVIQAIDNNELSHALRLLNEHYLYLQHEGGGNESSLDAQTPHQQEITRLEHTWIHCMTAVIFATRASRNVKTPGYDRHNINDDMTQSVNDDLTAIRVQMARAQQISPKNWKGFWCFAITFWLISGGDTTAQEWEDVINNGSESPASSHPLHLPGVSRFVFYTACYASKALNEIGKTSDDDRYEIAKTGFARLFIYYTELMQQLVATAKSGLKVLSGKSKPRSRPTGPSTPPSSSPSPESTPLLPMSPLEDRTDWLRLLYPFPFPTTKNWNPSDRLLYNGILMNPLLYGTDDYTPSVEEIRSMMIRPHDENTTSDGLLDMQLDENDTEGNETNNDSDDDDSSSDSDDSGDYLERVMDYLSMEDGHFFDIGFEDDSDLSGVDELERHQRSIRADFHSDVGIIGHRRKYTGHGNIRTIKDVNFYGAQDEYIVSGSDDGRAFVWDKKTGKVAQILEADQDTVNVIQGHPFLPNLAISGIDNTVKIYTPTGALNTSSSSQMEQADDIVARNARYHRDGQRQSFLTRSFLENVARLSRQQHPDWLIIRDSDDEDDTDDLFSSGTGDTGDSDDNGNDSDTIIF